MPEGDTIHRIARVLGAELPGKPLDVVSLSDQGEIRELAGARVEGVRAVGKHLLIQLERGWTLRVHLGMNGRWRRLHARERRPRDPTVLLVSGDVAYVCQGAYRAELVRLGFEPLAALFAASGAITPRMSPLPNRSFGFQNITAQE